MGKDDLKLYIKISFDGNAWHIALKIATLATNFSQVVGYNYSKTYKQKTHNVLKKYKAAMVVLYRFSTCITQHFAKLLDIWCL